MMFPRLPLTVLSAFLLLAVAALPARASNTLTALAYQNLGVQVLNVSNNATVSASHCLASSFASRSQVRATTDGFRAVAQTHYGASAGSTSEYSLWDMGRNLPLDLSAAASLELSFNFELVGQLEVDAIALSAAATRYNGGVDYTSGRDNFQGAFSVSYGNIFPFPQLGYVTIGDGELWGSYSLSFSARHRGATGGSITFTVTNNSSNMGRASSTMTLVSVGLLGGSPPPGGLGVNMGPTGLMIPVTEVPEPGTVVLWSAGLCGVLWLSRRRRPGINA